MTPGERGGGLSRDKPGGGLSRLGQENIVAVVLLFVFGGIIWLCQDFGPRARLIPLPMAIFGIVLTLIQLAWQNLRSTEDLQMDLLAPELPPALGDGKPASEAQTAPVLGARTASWRAELRAFGVIALLIILILVTGIIPAVFLFTGGYFVLTRHYSWLMGLVYTSVFTALVYVLFVFALQIQPYHGMAAPLIERFQ